jgi:hypothetical protein
MSPARIQLEKQMEMGTGNVHHQSLGSTRRGTPGTAFHDAGISKLSHKQKLLSSGQDFAARKRVLCHEFCWMQFY